MCSRAQEKNRLGGLNSFSVTCETKVVFAIGAEMGENVDGGGRAHMVLIERDGTRKPVCRVCRKAKEGREPVGQYSVFICGTCMEKIREESKEHNAPLGRPRRAGSRV